MPTDVYFLTAMSVCARTVLTQDQNVSKYRNILDVKIELESRLASHLTEHLNSEIVLKSIKDIESMLVWAKSTFFAEVWCHSSGTSILRIIDRLNLPRRDPRICFLRAANSFLSASLRAIAQKQRAKKVPARYFPMLRGTEVGEASRKVDHLIRDMCLQGL